MERGLAWLNIVFVRTTSGSRVVGFFRLGVQRLRVCSSLLSVELHYLSCGCTSVPIFSQM